MDQATQNALNTLQAQITALKNAPPRESVFAPSSQDPYVVQGPRDFYSYTQEPFVSADDTTSVTYQIEADSYFYMNALSYFALPQSSTAEVQHATNVIPRATIVIFDSGSGRQLMANPTPLNNIVGEVGGQPFRLPKPRRFAPTSQITVTVVSLDGTNDIDFYLTLSGFKVYASQAVAVNGPVGTSS